MKNKLDLTLPPEQLFLNPAQDAGFALLHEPEFTWRPQPRGMIEGFSVSAHGVINKKIEQYLVQTRRHRKFTKALEFNVVPALLTNAEFRKSQILVGEKLLLSGASGVRAQSRFRRDKKTKDIDPEPGLIGYFNLCQNSNLGSTFAIHEGPIPDDTDFVIICRNTFNYYHFVTEALCQLTLLDQMDFEGHIFFHYPNSSEKHRNFTQDFVETLFPELYGRVTFERVPKGYAHVLMPYELSGSYYQFPAEIVPDVGEYAPSDNLWLGKTANEESQSILAMNSFSSSLMALRTRALAAIEGQDFNHLPKRFFVGRDDRYSRQRLMDGQDLLFEHLDLFDFDYVVFESLTPLEQIALMANAEMMISYHGAGFTNMLFANSDAYVVEIGTLQTAQSRWADFWPLANISACRYVSFFGDFNADDPLSEPKFSRDGIVPVALSKDAIAQIMAFVVTVFGQFAELSSDSKLLTVAQQVFAVGAVAQANELLEVNAELVKSSAPLCLLKADCHKHFDEPKSELIHLDAAFRADPNRWQILVRMIWCANRCERPEVLKRVLARLHADFPDRHHTFVNNHEWVRYVA